MHWLLLLPIVYLAAVVQTSLADVIQVGRVAPDLLAMVAVIWVVQVGGPRAFLVAGAIGLVEDLLSPGCIGPGMAGFLLVGYGVNWLRRRLSLDHLVLEVLTVGGAVTVLVFGLSLAQWLLGEASLAWGILLERALGVGIYTAGVSLPAWMIVGWSRQPRRAPRFPPSSRLSVAFLPWFPVSGSASSSCTRPRT